ncbi:hypothetical protein [Halalkalibacterium ligniniphilum]|uniref:hypothetical protein n=1 Tax=Halalkalibacterium ligniniphilum TaxID=1134413 RepID=UPI00034D3C4A|nr:hypothetical protein [Halalkalibacterium ligniniphilum]
MTLLATQRCIEIRQEIGWTEKRIIENEYEMKLYHDKVTVRETTYPIHTIFDVSYRKKPKALGYLYLHTNGGVRTYYIKEEPGAFIDAYQQLKREDSRLR